MRQALVEARARAGLSQQDVAEAIGISRPFYTLIERGARNPSLTVALRIAELFGGDPRDLFSPRPRARRRRRTAVTRPDSGAPAGRQLRDGEVDRG